MASRYADSRRDRRGMENDRKRNRPVVGHVQQAAADGVTRMVHQRLDGRGTEVRDQRRTVL